MIKESAEKLVETIEVEAGKAKVQLEAAQPALDEAEAALNVILHIFYPRNAILLIILDFRFRQ